MTLKELFSHRILTISNLLSLSRILLLAPLAWLMWNEREPGQYLCEMLLLAFTMILTDYLDGFFARRLGQETPLGQYLDPIADKITILIALYLLYLKRDYPLWLFLVILVREVYGSFFGVFLLTKRHILGKPNLWGKVGVFLISISAVLYLIDHPAKKYLDIPILGILIVGVLAYSVRYIRTVFNITRE